MKSGIKLTASMLALIIVIVFSVVSLASCGGGNGKTVPIYKGMQISGNTDTVLNPGNIQLTAQNNGNGNGYGNGNGNGLGHGNNPNAEGGVGGDIVPEEEEILPADPFGGSSEENLEEEIKDNIGVIGSDKEIYYTKQNKDIYVNIKIDNPDSYEILSFTFNGVKYSDYMFEYGSTLENIIIKVNVGDAVGVIEYTIDAMKYIDENNQIKDVIMEGDKTVKAGVRTLNMVHPEIENLEVGTNSLSCDLVIFDQYNLITHFGGKSFALIYDGEKLVDYTELQYPKDEETGDIIGMARGKVDFKGLKTNTVYQFAVVSFFDNLDGKGFGPQVIHKQSFRTNSIVLFENIAVGDERVDFELSWKENWANKNLASLKLFLDDEFVKEADASLGYVDGLLSGRKYKLVAEYDNGENRESVFIEFTTYGKEEPTAEGKGIAVNGNSLSGEYVINDADGTLVSYMIELLRGDEIVYSDYDGKFSFENLEYYTEYTLRFVYIYNLNDGEGDKKVETFEKFYTSPYIAVKGITVNNSSAIVTGGNLMLTISIDNPSGALVKTITVFGIETAVTGNQNTLIASVAIPSGFEGGAKTVKVEKVSVEKDGISFEMSPLGEASADVFVNGLILAKKAELLLNEDRVISDYATPGDEAYLRIYLDNKTGYNIHSVNIGWREITDFVKISDEIIEVKVTLGGGWNLFSVSKVSYSNDYISDSVFIEPNISSNAVLAPENSEPIYISTPAELLEAVSYDGYRYYELADDLDFTNIIWTPARFKGILNGKGYSIKNLNVTTAVTNTNLSLGLFSAVSGVVSDINIKDSFFWGSVSSTSYMSYELSIGAVCGQLDAGIIKNCTVAESVTFAATNNTQGSLHIAGIVGSLGGEFGEFSSGKIINCENNADISVNGYSANVGGILGFGYAFGAIDFDGCKNNGDITGRDVGGIAAAIGSQSSGAISFTNCENSGKITSTAIPASVSDIYYAGGIAGRINVDYRGSVIIDNCENSGDVKGHYVGGIAAYVYGNDLPSGIYKNSLNTGSIESTAENGHAGGIFGYINLTTGCVTTGLKNTGAVTGTDGVGGIFGSLYIVGVPTVNQLLNLGEVTGNNGVGGICGTLGTDLHAEINNVCVSDLENGGKILGENNVGGIFGSMSPRGSALTLKYLVNTGLVKAKNEYAGGIIGNLSSYCDITIIGAVNFGGVVANEYGAGVIAKIYAYEGLEMEYLANAGEVFGGRNTAAIVSTAYSSSSPVFVLSFPDYSDKLENAEFYTETVGFDAAVWDLENISIEDGKYPHLLAFAE